MENNKLICPFCQQELSETIWEYGERETTCSNCDITGNSKLWQELIRTHKALGTIRLHLMAAKGRFNFYDEYLVSGIDTPHARFIKEEIEKALEQITAEQKD